MTYWDIAEKRNRLRNAGVKVVVPAYPDWHFMVRPLDDWNLRYHRAVARIAKQPDVREYLEKSREPDYVSTEGDLEIDRRMVREALAEGCIASWHVTDRKGKPLKLNLENAMKVLETFPEIEHAITTTARDAKLFEVKGDDKLADAKLELAAGN